MYGYYYFDPTYLLLVIGMVLSLLASAKVKSTFSVYSRVHSASGLTGADAARRILRMSGITDVTVVPISGSLTDHWHFPRMYMIKHLWLRSEWLRMNADMLSSMQLTICHWIFVLRLYLLQTLVLHFPGHCSWRDWSFPSVRCWLWELYCLLLQLFSSL